jgi:DNA-binding transcriptional MocR family regulator
MLLLKINRSGETPVYRQIVKRIVDLIENETLESGSALPSSRRLAKEMGLNRSTVYRAYEELGALGYIGSRPGSYTRVRKRPGIVSDVHGERRGLVNWSRKSNAAGRFIYNFFKSYAPESQAPGSGELINFSLMDLDHRIFPIDDFRRCMNQVLINEGPTVLQYGEYAGYTPLREVIARRMQVHGITAASDEILVTNGAQQAFDLILKMLAAPGARVAVESPTYSNALPLIRHHDLGIAGIPMLDDGMDLGRLGTLLQEGNIAFVYTIPNFHNPTGITTSQVHREGLLSICEEYRVPVVEDGFEEEMKYFGKAVLPIKSMDKNQVVMYLGTFSKVLFPGIRLGWIVAERECIRRLTAIKRFVDLSTSTVIQAAVATFCRDGYYDKHIKRMHRLFRKRMEIALGTLKNNMPRGVEWTKPDGGYTIWVKLERPYKDRHSLNGFLSGHGVLVSPGDYYFNRPGSRRYFRLSIASLNEVEIEKGIVRLAQALGEWCATEKR